MLIGEYFNHCACELFENVFLMNGVPLHISVPGKGVPCHKESKYDKQSRLAET